ncbi:uncharacterized protein K460DRAFT_136556 [Cucurbitaria berberidis CBS 394.84]|uniref:Uncharacterized protein n=1 Tax=Cucurbitaria berberidis CBS 394.84 TaxID=1168544 RepID=A0A9P4GCC7_9PLEO|nr:uncharacterized protein K460DRAFT_136556 [Cucurbitaria berberidis CBS 394.84]KAF1842909.1 hypothetical protein K460DRAFT_136556 [Cucurbitaria berberidis CBS 394.84]
MPLTIVVCWSGRLFCDFVPSVQNVEFTRTVAVPEVFYTQDQSSSCAHDLDKYLSDTPPFVPSDAYRERCRPKTGKVTTGPCLDSGVHCGVPRVAFSRLFLAQHFLKQSGAQRSMHLRGVWIAMCLNKFLRRIF